ncbi:MAG: phospho-N-acetylmuramoyl-pentapeptide-transferase, partial [Candidatus Spyradocola sp.]
DGLCSSVTTGVTLTLGLIALVMNQAGLDEAASSNVMVLCLATAGACMGFLRFNTYPAKVFMGDSGSFGLGGAVVMAALVLRQPLLIVIMGIMYVLTSLSDIIQVFAMRFLHRRPFRMAPLHHHFEMGGVPETRIVAMYTLVTAIACVVALLSLSL